MTVFKDSEDLSHCLDCKKPTVWVRRTQFCGNHPYCDEHARRQGDFGHEDPSYFFWDCVAPQRLPAGEDLAAEMAADPEFVRCAEEGWQAIDEGCCRRITDLEVEGLHFVKDGEVFSGQEARKVGGDPPQEVMATASQCWALEVGGDRCVLRAGHPGPHMGGHHTFEHLLPEEEVASVLGSTIDILQSECGRLRAEVERWQLRFAEADQAVLRLTADLARMTAERDGLRETLGDCICMLDILASEFGDPEGSIRGQIAESSAAVAACAPPASDVEHPEGFESSVPPSVMPPYKESPASGEVKP